ncbi:MAG: site-specific integrase [Ferruginibacter sp.]
MKQTLKELMEQCVQFFEQQSFSVRRINRYQSVWERLKEYMIKRPVLFYNASVGQEFIDSYITEETAAPYERDILRCIHVLDEFQEKGIISKRYYKSVKLELSGPVGNEMARFISHLQSLRRSKSTISVHRMYLYRFLTYLTSQQIYCIQDIKEVHIGSFLSTSTNNKIGAVSCLRMFLDYLFDEQKLKSSIQVSLQYFKPIQEDKLPSVYSKEEVIAIEGSIVRSDATGKRNYALTLLATRLGFRASDIAHLSFQNLDWAQSTITLLQFKTGRELRVPLLAEVGEAIIDYLKYGRSKSESDRVFLYTRAPFSPMENLAVSSAIRAIICASGVNTSGRKKGPHAMRHSLASRFLENKVSMPVISNALGHQSTNTTMSYLRIDVTSLRQCALDVPSVLNQFYNQKGGIFYE